MAFRDWQSVVVDYDADGGINLHPVYVRGTLTIGSMEEGEGSQLWS